MSRYNLPMPRAVKKSATKPERDILQLIAAEDHRPQHTSRRIGIHTSTAGGVEPPPSAPGAWVATPFRSSAPARACGGPTTSPPSSARPWPGCARIRPEAAGHPRQLPHQCRGNNCEFLEKSVGAFRAELERAVSLGAEYVVLHPGSYRGCSREEGLSNACAAIARATEGSTWRSTGSRC